jgi:hypothetical protein
MASNLAEITEEQTSIPLQVFRAQNTHIPGN